MKMLIYQGDLPPSCETEVPEADVLGTMEMKVYEEHSNCFAGYFSRAGNLGFFRIVDDVGTVRHQDCMTQLGIGVTLPYTVYPDTHLLVSSGKAMDDLAPYMQPSLGAECPECFGTGLRGGFGVRCSGLTCKLPIG